MERKKLLNALEKVKPGIASKEIVESMTYFHFSGKNIVTYNDKISIQHPLKTDFNLFVKANDLYKIISKLPADKITLARKEDKLNVRCKTLNANLSIIDDPEVKTRIATVDMSLKKAKWKKLPSNFNESISLCAFSASKQESDQTLSCVYINEMDCIASDNSRIAHSILTEAMQNMLIKASEVHSLIAIKPTKYYTSKAWLHFKNEDNCIFSIRKIEGDFPDYFQFFDFEGTEINLPKDILTGIDITSILADQLDPFITIKISNDSCIISGKSEAGKVQHKSKIDYTGKEISFEINPDFIREMMSHSSSIVISKERAKLQTDSDFSLVTSLYV